MSIILAAGAARMKLEAENYEARISELEAKLADIDNLLDEDQGEDDGAKIMPDFEAGMTTLAKVEACTFLLEKRRDVIEAFEAENARLKARLAEALKALEKSENLFEAISHHIDEHSFSFAKGFCSQGAFTARRVREGGKVDG